MILSNTATKSEYFNAALLANHQVKELSSIVSEFLFKIPSFF
jgi:hypothetical protein